jgi:hypothetical protein
MTQNSYQEYKEWKAKQSETLEIEDTTRQHQLSASTVKDRHEWRQEGTHLVCRSCPSAHGHYIGIDKLMTGMDEKGNPIIEKRQ